MKNLNDLVKENLIVVKGLGGFQNLKNQFFFAYLIIKYVYNILLYGAGIDDSMWVKKKKNFTCYLNVKI